MNRGSVIRWLLIAAVFLALLIAPLALAQFGRASFSGIWEMSSDLVIPGQEEPCRFVGEAQIRDNGQLLQGTVQLVLVEGPAGCPPEMSAELIAGIDFPVIFEGRLLGGIFGEASFDGSLVEQPAKLVPSLLLEGAVVVTEGPFQDAPGSWGAMVTDGVFRDSFENILIMAGGASLFLLGITGLRRRRRD